METTRVDGVRFNVDAALLTWIGKRKVPFGVALRLLREALLELLLEELLAGLGLADHLDRAVAEPACVTCVGSAPRRWRAATPPRRRQDHPRRLGRRKSPRDEVLDLRDVPLLGVVLALLLVVPNRPFPNIRIIIARIIIQFFRVLVQPA